MKVLPIVGEPETKDTPSCVVISGGLSVEQALVANDMLAVKRQVREVAGQLETATDERADLEKRMAALRQRWAELVVQRDEARRRKMQALGYEG